MSRIAHRAFFFDEEEKNRFAELLMLPDKPKSRFQRNALAWGTMIYSLRHIHRGQTLLCPSGTLSLVLDPLKPADIAADLKAVEAEAKGLLAEVTE